MGPPAGPLDASPAPLGVGLVYWQALEPLFSAGDGRISALELEPQTLWEQQHDAASGARYRVNAGLLQRVAVLPQKKLMHGVGQPLGGSCDDPLDWHTPWQQCVRALQPAWASEHLSFNRFQGEAGIEQTSFLLPPRQTPAGVAVAARRLHTLRQVSGVPVAFETGVNYLQPRDDELPDGEFFAQVATAAGSGILLDLHNLWVNERNGRQRMADVLASLPLDRVWELHLAGGALLDGYWLDAHDRLADSALIERAAELLPRLPHLGAIVFEVLPQYVQDLGLDAVSRQVDVLQALWRQRPATVRRAPAALRAALQQPDDAAMADLRCWEHSLGRHVLGQPALPGCAPMPGLAADPGLAIFERLVREFRCGRIVRVMRYSALALLRACGPAGAEALMQAYCRQCPSDLYTAVEADHFARYLRGQIEAGSLQVPWLAEVLAFEHAMVRASLCGESTLLNWSVDPVRLFEALESGEGLDALPALTLRMAVDGSAG